jgi:hypothetical protein
MPSTTSLEAYIDDMAQLAERQEQRARQLGATGALLEQDGDPDRAEVFYFQARRLWVKAIKSRAECFAAAVQIARRMR